MKTTIRVKNRAEGEAIRRGLDDPSTRVFVQVMGLLLELPSDRARARVVGYMADRLVEHEDAEATP